MYKIIRFRKTGISVIIKETDNYKEYFKESVNDADEVIVINDKSIIVDAAKNFKNFIGISFDDFIKALVYTSYNFPEYLTNDKLYYAKVMYILKRTPDNIKDSKSIKSKSCVKKGIFEDIPQIPIKEYNRIYKKGYVAGQRFMKDKMIRLLYDKFRKNYYLEDTFEKYDDLIESDNYMTFNIFEEMLSDIIETINDMV